VKAHHSRNGPGGEGGSFLRSVFNAPSVLAESLPPIGLLAISLALSAFLVAVATSSLLA
jgi:hypothetical protein